MATNEELWRSIGGLEQQAIERTRQIEKLFTILGDVKYESTKIAASVESLSENFKRHMEEEGRDFAAVMAQLKEHEEKCGNRLTKLEERTELVLPEEDTKTVKEIVGVWKFIATAAKSAVSKVLIAAFVVALIAVAATFGIKISMH